ncbi:hypothetical protein [Legionella bononiensis]|uniref:Dot/Icm T4SS effector n=1 Tax=Legionella bononiensis TaxID=2793102 RepID=A0ABS1WBP2_9GAMM|nr:hypothetical protein [Legionella bononiensis]MBL7481077.1 hypothetical protein [Legionella bononiensis]MBL7526786.1 hypothetical protein [Legionella bononiensis]MBL7564193.1 hypothetical protein [Legionella bononiensis]
MLSIDQVKEELASQDCPISIEAMTVAVASLKHYKDKHHSTFNCVVLNLDDKNPEQNEFNQFLIQLNQNKNLYPENTRIQIIFKHGNHWSTMDVRVNQGQLEFYFLDAANSMPTVLQGFSSIFEHCPNAKLTYSGAFLQMEGKHCPYFALDHALAFSKINDLHETLRPCVSHENIGRFEHYADYIQFLVQSRQELSQFNRPSFLEAIKLLNYVKIIDLPQHFGSLIKHIQDLDYYRTNVSGRNFVRYNGKPVNDYVKQHSRNLNGDNPYSVPKLCNMGIVDKKLKIKKRAAEFLAGMTEQEYSTLVDRRKSLGLVDCKSTPQGVLDNPNAMDLKDQRVNEPEKSEQRQARVIELQFKRNLNLLHEKKSEFELKVNKGQFNYKKAFDAASALHKELVSAGEAYFANPTQDRYREFKRVCDKSITANRLELEKHRGLVTIILNITAIILTAGIGYGIALGIGMVLNGSKFSFFSTDSVKKINAIEDAIMNAAPNTASAA